jgi:hypothetical protein
MNKMPWIKAVLVALLLSLGISIVATTVSTFVHKNAANNLCERFALFVDHP